ncbi:flagellar filament capping protein FliD [Paenibacillus sp. UMB7766-LJ446]|uniref:flagellar filament capping protein FliD n=1 Tax=Paenibacillus sp. UMB7766-LJ446 TaxID=3046313 RepID=UPI00254BB70D|nr:flagellar filament capping protein FliD [Paenibacillus sp. UMB7766-LJ446]MDK8194480.1 flagellar filament capping protein FliD [Paenibacillus sp. UMB7766-LJ446]
MVTRINGFSGMDIESMVKSMMATKRVPLDKLNQEKQLLQWQRESYRELSSKLYDFRSNKLITKYGSSTALNANKATVTGNTDAVKAEASATANGVEMKVSVTQLAKSATVSTSGLGQGVSGSTSLAALEGVDLSKMGSADMAKYLQKGFDIKINGVSFTDKDGKSLFNGMTSISTLVSTINTNTQANAIASYDEITGKLSIASKTGGLDSKVIVETPTGGNSVLALFSKKTVIETNGAGTGVTDDKTLADLYKLSGGKDPESGAPAKTYSFVLNGKTFNFSETDKISDVVDKINSGDAKATASFADGKLTITALSGEELKMSGGSYDFMNLFKGTKSYEDVTGQLTSTAGQDAIVSVNDEPLKDIKSNTFSLNGVQITLMDVTTKNGVDTPTIIKNQSDPDKALESIKGFIEDYNTLIKALNSKVEETKYRDFKPLTDEQKKELKESEIDTWTEKAKSGLLKNDDIIKSVLSEMRAVITEKLGPLSALGITTGNYSENGKLVIENETKLKNMISSNPQLALDLFQGPASAPNEGIFDKLADKVSNAIEKVYQRAGTNRYTTDITSAFRDENIMGRKMKDYNNRILTMQTNLQRTEDRYYKQFAAMEAAMNKMQTQSSSLFSSLGQS